MLEGRIALCAGAGRGVGAEVAKLMAAYGAKVVINDPGTSGSGEGLDQAPAQQIVDQIKGAGGDAAANYGSVAKFDDCLAMVQQARETFGGLHIVFNAAGILRDKMFHNMFPEDWQAVIDVHLTGHFNINRAAINLFREQNYGRIIMVSSTSGLLGNVGQCNYGAAKFGIVALARIVAMENAAKGITVNVICPTTVQTPMVQPEGDDDIPDDLVRRMMRANPIPQPWLQAEDVSRGLLYLVTDPGVITGSVLEISLGSSARIH